MNDMTIILQKSTYINKLQTERVIWNTSVPRVDGTSSHMRVKVCVQTRSYLYKPHL